jgi:hypothetical protein
MTTPAGQPTGKPRVRRHLIDPDNPPRRRSGSSMSITQVQRWVLSALAVTTILHLSVGLMLAAIFLDESRVDGRIGLNVIAGLVGAGAVAAALAIHQKSILSPWLLLGAVPTAVGLYLTF